MGITYLDIDFINSPQGLGVQNLTELSGTSVLNIPNLQKKLVVDENSEYIYYSGATSGDVKPEVQINNMGWWIKYDVLSGSSSSYQLSGDSLFITYTANTKILINNKLDTFIFSGYTGTTDTRLIDIENDIDYISGVTSGNTELIIILSGETINKLDSVQAGTGGISIDNTDTLNPIISFTGSTGGNDGVVSGGTLIDTILELYRTQSLPKVDIELSGLTENYLLSTIFSGYTATTQTTLQDISDGIQYVSGVTSGNTIEINNKLDTTIFNSYTGNTIEIADVASNGQLIGIVDNQITGITPNYVVISDFTLYSGVTESRIDDIESDIDNIFENINSVIYVAQNGNDLNTGLKRNEPKQSIQSAINVATTGTTVVVLDGSIYEESITGVNYVNIYAPYASLDLSNGRQLNLAAGLFKFRSIYRTSGSNIMIIANQVTPLTGRPYSVLELEEISDAGSGITVQNGLNQPLDLHIKQVFLRNSNTFLEDLHDSTSHTHITFDDLYFNSPNATGFTLSNGGNILGNIQHIKELGTGIGSGTAFNIISGEVNLVAQDTRITTVANIENAGSFRFSSQRFSGEIYNNGGGQYGYYTSGANGENLTLSSNLNIILDSNTLTLPQASGNTGAFLSVGTGGLINYSTLTTPALEWTDDTEGVGVVGTTVETIVYSVIVDNDVSAGNMSYQLHYTPAYYMTATARIRLNNVSGTILNTTSFNGAGSQILSYSLPITTGNSITSGTTIVLTIQFSAAAANNVNNGGFLTVLKSGSALTTFESIIGNPLDNTSLETLFNDKLNTTATAVNSTKWNGYNNWVGTQVDYDLLVPDANTFYFIPE